MNNLLDGITDIVIPNFERRDTSANHIVTRSAKRIETKGFTVTAIEQEKTTTRRFDFGLASYGIREVKAWRISFRGTVIPHEGFLFVRESCLTYHVSHPDSLSKRDRQWHEFLPDRKETAQLLGLQPVAKKKSRRKRKSRYIIA